MRRTRAQTAPSVSHQDPESDKYLGVLKGTVKRFHETAGYGFINDNKGEDYFVHYSYIRTSGFANLAKGQKVQFEGYEGKKGLYARDVVVVCE